MSNHHNDVLAEDLFARLEAVGSFMNSHEYADKQTDLLRLLTARDFEDAQAYVLEVERQYKHLSDYEGTEADHDLD